MVDDSGLIADLQWLPGVILELGPRELVVIILTLKILVPHLRQADRFAVLIQPEIEPAMLAIHREVTPKILVHVVCQLWDRAVRSERIQKNVDRTTVVINGHGSAATRPLPWKLRRHLRHTGRSIIRTVTKEILAAVRQSDHMRFGDGIPFDIRPGPT
ncbi:MAG: hypothetical protein O2857_17375 [Planctomycetota bacterium]|nr:hypothetical protein [Planctomycetota bacterium]